MISCLVRGCADEESPDTELVVEVSPPPPPPLAADAPAPLLPVASVVNAPVDVADPEPAV